MQKCKHFYNTLYNSAADNLREMILSSPFSYMQSVDKDMQLNSWSFLNFAEGGSSRERMKAFEYFYHINERFPTDNNLISALDREIPDFISLGSFYQIILPLHLNEISRLSV